jgi:hypothetical protein
MDNFTLDIMNNMYILVGDASMDDGHIRKEILRDVMMEVRWPSDNQFQAGVYDQLISELGRPGPGVQQGQF